LVKKVWYFVITGYMGGKSMVSELGQQTRGSGHHFSKLTEEEVHKVRYLLNQRETVRKMMEGLTLEAIGRRLGVGKNAIYHIAKGNSWRHLADEEPAR
jgi:hypothetical protein